MLDLKTNLNKHKRIKIRSIIFSGYNGMKLGINYKMKTGKNTNVEPKITYI